MNGEENGNGSEWERCTVTTKDGSGLVSRPDS